jgi:FkbM family methyltransferase
MTKTAICLVVKNEAAGIREWIAFHALIGFGTFLILDDGSTDETVALANQAGQHLDVRVMPWGEQERNRQGAGYVKICHRYRDEFDWIAFIDSDEFLLPMTGESLETMLARHADHAGIAFPWRLFGSSGHRTKPPGLVIENFQYCTPVTFGPNQHVKSMVRPSCVISAPNPHYFEVDGPYALADGRPVDWGVGPGILNGYPPDVTWRVNHYFTRSLEHWTNRGKRGQMDDLPRTMEEFHDYDENGIHDARAASYAPRVRALIAGESLEPARAEAPAKPMPVAAPEPNRPETCAVVLIVKNEISDIGAWLAWYHVLGFNACIVFDDGSTDGTWEFLQGAATIQDIRLFKAPGAAGGRYEVRQQEFYVYALQNFREEFDWLAFLDADEFLYLAQDDTIQKFLARFPHADAVVVNWCNYGSGGHFLKPEAPPFEAFTWHGNEQRNINRHVKTIVRTAKVGPVWQNVHAYDVPPDRYVLPNGEKIRWSETRGIIDHDPDWSIAKVMHYQCRSMEHFIERLKRHPRMASIANIWNGHDVNDVRSTVPQHLLDAAKQQMARLQAAQTEVPTAMAPATPPDQDAIQRKQTVKLGIAITTYNRKSMLLEQIECLKNLTSCPFELVVCDDGSSDGTVEALRNIGVKVIGGTNRGIAWNKNRGLFYLREIYGADVILLLDDDLLPERDGWEQEWIEGVQRWGHINFQYPNPEIILGSNIPADPGVSNNLLGACVAFSRDVLSYVGYMDTRFKGYGNEHTDLTARAIRAGFGGFIIREGERRWRYFYSIHGGIKLEASVSNINSDHIAHNSKILAESENEPIYRNAWRDDEEYDLLRSEMAPLHGFGGGAPYEKQIFANDRPLAEALIKIDFQALQKRTNLNQALPTGSPAVSVQTSERQEETKQVIKKTSVQDDLIFDIGMSEGNDSEFYLAKGFRVVGVEADVKTYFELCQRFSKEISAGRLKIENFAASDSADNLVEFFHHDLYQGLSGLSRGRAEFKEGNFTSYFVSTINWPTLVARHGVPYYLKIDIEGAEAPFLSSMVGSDILPTYISVECYSLAPVEALYNLGYRHFKLVDQDAPGGFSLPAIQQEGLQIDWPKFDHSSGPFGRDLPEGPWLTLENFIPAWHAAMPAMKRTWFDCHAWSG